MNSMAHKTSCRTAFTLVELLFVIALIALLAVLAVPAINGIGSANATTRAGQMLEDQCIIGRQRALALNRDVEIRIINLGTSSDPEYTGLQIWQLDETGANPKAIGPMKLLPDGVTISPKNNLSPLLGATTGVSGSLSGGSANGRDYRGFKFRANGSCGPGLDSSMNFLTVARKTDTAEPPANFYTVRISNATGRVTSYRP